MNAIEELSVEIKIAQAELDQLIYIHKHYRITELLSDISIKHSQLRDLRESFTSIKSNMLLLTTRTPTDMVMQSVAKEFKVSVELIKSPCRKREYSEARQAFIGLAYKRRVVTQEYLADLLDRNHSTINTAIDTFSDLYDTNKPFREKVIKVKQVLDII